MRLGPVAPGTHDATFALVQDQSALGGQVSALVKRRLEAMGHTGSASPDYLVLVSPMLRAANTGAFIPATGGEKATTWVDRPDSRHARPKRLAYVVRVYFLSPTTRVPVAVSTSRMVASARTVSSPASLAELSERMVDAMFVTDPMRAIETLPQAANQD